MKDISAMSLELIGSALRRIPQTRRKSMRPLILATTLLAILGPSAFAQTQMTSPTDSSQTGAPSSRNDQTANPQNNSSGQNAAEIQQIRQDLQKAGFTDVRIVAQSFVVQARSKDGNPVLMTIGPHGMSVFEAQRSGGSNSGTVGSDTGSGGSNSPSSNTQNQGMRKQ